MKAYTIEQRLVLGGTDYGKRLAAEIVKHPEIAEVLETTVESAGAQDNYAAKMRIVYRAKRHLSWHELRRAVVVDVPIYDVSDIDIEALEKWQGERLDRRLCEACSTAGGELRMDIFHEAGEPCPRDQRERLD